MMPSKLNGSIQRKVKISGLAKMIIVFYPFVLFFHTIYYFQSFPIEKRKCLCQSLLAYYNLHCGSYLPSHSRGGPEPAELAQLRYISIFYHSIFFPRLASHTKE